MVLVLFGELQRVEFIQRTSTLVRHVVHDETRTRVFKPAVIAIKRLEIAGSNAECQSLARISSFHPRTEPPHGTCHTASNAA